MGVFRCSGVRSGPTQFAWKQKDDEFLSLTKRRRRMTPVGTVRSEARSPAPADPFAQECSARRRRSGKRSC
jgi:hypothetical protein